MLPIEVSLTVPTSSADGIFTADTLGGAGAFTLDGSYVTDGVAYMPSGVARRVLLTFAGDETGHNFTVTGTSRSGSVQSEVIAGTTAGTVYSALDYLTVTSVTVDAATTDDVSGGTNAVASSRWVYASPHMTPVNVAISCEVSGTVNYTVQYCYKDPAGHPYDFPQTGPVNVPVFDDAVINAVTARGVAIMNDPITAWRVTMNSGSGTVSATAIQAGIAGN